MCWTRLRRYWQVNDRQGCGRRRQYLWCRGGRGWSWDTQYLSAFIYSCRNGITHPPQSILTPWQTTFIDRLLLNCWAWSTPDANPCALSYTSLTMCALEVAFWVGTELEWWVLATNVTSRTRTATSMDVDCVLEVTRQPKPMVNPTPWCFCVGFANP